MRGRVKSFSRKDGYGFISAEDKEIFFHSNQCEDKPEVGDIVIFNLIKTGKGFRAVRVRREYNK